jgi:hypothetical protein
MKKLLFLLILSLLVIQCKTSKSAVAVDTKPITIANDSLEYDIIIIDIGFDSYLNTIAKPMNFYSQDYYEQKNRFYVPAWNHRVRTSRTGKWSQVSENEIDYDFKINYGLEVNYKLFNYFKFVEHQYNIKLY